MKRNIVKVIKFNDEEYAIILKRAKAMGVRTGTYIRRIAVNGEVKIYDVSVTNDLYFALHKIGVEINQIAKVVNSTESVYKKDIEDLQKEVKRLDLVLENYLTPLEYKNL